jgi:hypothetical protein
LRVPKGKKEVNKTETVACRCTLGAAASFQDRQYGVGRRVFTMTAKGEACCTVCSTKHDVKVEHRPKKKGGGGGGGSKSYRALPPKEGWPGGLPEKNGWRP